MSRRWFYAFFIVSGFCSLTYEVVWLRLAMAQFGVNTPLVAIVLSVFMGGMAVGSMAAGRLSDRIQTRTNTVPLRLYTLAELVIGVSCLAVPPLLLSGHALLNVWGEGAVWGSGSYYLMSGLCIGLALFLFTACMGATFPLAMWAIRKTFAADEQSFSSLYVANVLGATAGTVASAFVLVELLGFRRTMLVAGGLNLAIAIAAWIFSGRGLSVPTSAPLPTPPVREAQTGLARTYGLPLLFTIGLMSLGMEVVWTRQFTPYLGTVVYAFSGTLALYLGATFLGSTVYRQWINRQTTDDLRPALRWALIAIGVAGVLPIVLSDPRLPVPLERVWGLFRIFFGVFPFCAVVGFLSPLLVDALSGGNPRTAGNAYAINTLGCILGPLIASFILLPFLSERWATLAFLAPPVLAGLALIPVRRHVTRGLSFGLPVGLAVVLVAVVAASSDPEGLFPERSVKRDYTATVVAATVDGQKHLFVNGQGMVYLTPVTKMMAHLPIALRRQPTRDGLVICFGMGTSLRSMHSWGVSTTGVELVPSVPSLIGYFHKDGPALLQAPGMRVVIDDGRRFMERTPAEYDVITVDPPPPVETAGSSLLYSIEWYDLIKKRLRPDGILQEWLPYGDRATLTAVAKSLQASFPYIKVFNSFEGWGFHFIASMSPIPDATAAELASRLPQAAIDDLVELGPQATAEAQFESVLRREVSMDTLLGASADAPMLTDDFPVNEYFLWRRLLSNDWNIYFSYQSGKFVTRRINDQTE